MSGNSADNGKEPFDDDEEEVAESTVAMSSPSFDPSIQSPISNPPPAMMGGVDAGPILQMPTAPVPFVPSPIGGVASMPNAGARPGFSPHPTPIGLNAPPTRGPMMAGANPNPNPNPNPIPIGPPPGGIPRTRPQTVIGLAPPAMGAQAPPPQPTPPSGPMAPRAPAPHVATPPRPPPSSNRIGSGAPPLPPRMATALGAAPPASAPVVARPVSEEEIPPWPDDDEELDPPGDGPTMAGSTEEALALFGLDEAAGNAARAAVHAPIGQQRGVSPMASTSHNPHGAIAQSSSSSSSSAGNTALVPPGEENATVAVPRDEIDRQRRQPGMQPGMLNIPSGPGGLGWMEEPSENEESTRAVPREELLRAQDAHVVADDDAVGEDATLAVAPGNNEANSKHLAALAETMASDGEFPPPLGLGGALHPPTYQNPHAPPPPPPPPPPHMMGMQMGFGPMGQMAPHEQQQQLQPHMNAPHQQQQQQWQQQPISNPHMQVPQSNPHLQVPPSNPQMPASNPYPQQGGYPMQHMLQPQQQQQQPMNAPMGYPNPPHFQPQNASKGISWVIPMPSGKQIKLSGQILLLAIVGVICLAIFITGIVLFATTKF